jgi:hypothetical protein
MDKGTESRGSIGSKHQIVRYATRNTRSPTLKTLNPKSGTASGLSAGMALPQLGGVVLSTCAYIWMWYNTLGTQVPFLETIHHFWIHALFIDVCNLFNPLDQPRFSIPGKLTPKAKSLMFTPLPRQVAYRLRTKGGSEPGLKATGR